MDGELRVILYFGFRVSAFGFIEIGGVAQLGERLPCTQEAIGSNPVTSTKFTTIFRSLTIA